MGEIIDITTIKKENKMRIPKQKELNITEVIQSTEAIQTLLKQKGFKDNIPYWLRRNLDNLKSKDTAYRETLQNRWNEEAHDQPETNFIAPDDYNKFREQFNSLPITATKEDVEILLKQVETPGNKSQKYMSVAEMTEFNRETNKMAEETIELISFYPILLTKTLEEVFSNVEGEVMGNLWWMLELEESVTTI